MQLTLDDGSDLRLPEFALGQDLSTYLAQLRKVVFSQTKHQNVTVVLGNPSCDLDSFICAFVFSYFYNAKPNASKHHKNPIYVPVLNLPYIETGDLWRLRPEFAVAVRGAFNGLTPQSAANSSQETEQTNTEQDHFVLEQLITIHELANSEQTLPSLRQAFKPSDKFSDQESGQRQDVILVDHNAPAVETITDEDLRKRLEIVGCVDHHVEEDYVSKKAQPRIVQLGIGSCMSLVMQHLRRLNLWTAERGHAKLPGYTQISRLALTPILIDTWNLAAPGDRVSELDREQVSFLDAQTGDNFDREDLYQQVQIAKAESENLLRMQEIFGRDYKSYNERLRNGQDFDIGIASTVDDLAWLANHAKGKERLVDEVVEYAEHGHKRLELFSLLTRSGVRKQLCIFGFGDHGRQALPLFEQTAGELKLQKWTEDKELSMLLDEKIGSNSWKIWWVGDTSRSRKQVAPLLREALQQTARQC